MVRTNKEQAIIDSAAREFRYKGFAQTRMANIAKNANLSYGLLYHYFDSKEKLFNAIIEDWWHEFHGRLLSLKEAPTDTFEKLEGVVEFVFDIFNKKPNETYIYFTEISRGFIHQQNPQWNDKVRRLYTVCRDIMKEGQEHGVLTQDIRPHYLAFIFMGAIDTTLSSIIFGNQELSPKREKEIIKGISYVFFNGAKSTSQKPPK